MLSRAAENLYWLSRYLERAENTARLINATSQVLLDLPRGAQFGWDNLVQVAGLAQLFQRAYPESNEANVMDFLISSQRNPGSIHSCVKYARENCRVIHNVLPREL
ncbi:MAG: alpha-E domain-containing protein [Proteobacteria bacterium]|nr:alpha-E domain-containing protein [Pseudomonadota bacterium]